MTKRIRTEHAGAKNGGGYWGKRAEAKALCDSLRRRDDREAVADQLAERDDAAWPHFEPDGDGYCPTCRGECEGV